MDFFEMLDKIVEDDVSEEENIYSVLDSFVDSTKQLLYDFAEKKLKNIEELLNKKDYIEKQIEFKENYLLELDKKISDIPSSFTNKVIERYTNGIVPNQKVFVLKKKYIDCPICGGSKKIVAETEIPDYKNIKVTCPRCAGFGRIESDEYYIKEKTVKDINLRLCFSSDGARVWENNTLELFGEPFLVNPKNVFVTIEDAEKYIKNS